MRGNFVEFYRNFLVFCGQSTNGRECCGVCNCQVASRPPLRTRGGGGGPHLTSHRHTACRSTRGINEKQRVILFSCGSASGSSHQRVETSTMQRQRDDACRFSVALVGIFPKHHPQFAETWWKFAPESRHLEIDGGETDFWCLFFPRFTPNWTSNVARPLIPSNESL